MEQLESRRLLSAGDLDPTFGFGGKVNTDFVGSGDEWIRDLVFQPDGKLIATGPSTNDLTLARYLVDGTLDPAFGVGGVVRLNLGSYDDMADAVALQADGKIVVAGWTQRTDLDYALARFNTDGTKRTGIIANHPAIR